jgi:hypothetical protein
VTIATYASAAIFSRQTDLHPFQPRIDHCNWAGRAEAVRCSDTCTLHNHALTIATLEVGAALAAVRDLAPFSTAR